MAQIAPVIAFPFETSSDVAVTTWGNLTPGDDGAAVFLAVYSDRTVQVGGAFGGSTVVIGGSNDGVTYYGLHDIQGELLTFTEGGLRAIAELPLHIKPWVTGGSGTDVTVSLIGRRSI